MLNVDKGDAHVNNRCKKLKKSSIQEIQDTRPMSASLLNRLRHVKYVSGYQNVKLKKLVFLRLHLTDSMFSNARSASLLIDTRPAFLRQNVGLIKSVFHKCR